jgi:hypothetical protein
MTQQTKHTPGPWGYERNPRTAYTFNVFADGIRIAEALAGPAKLQTDYFGGKWVDPNNAADGEDNARLIAAAPELLEALIWMTEHAAAHEEILRDHNLLDGESIYLADEAHTKARAAIAKATGGK